MCNSTGRIAGKSKRINLMDIPSDITALDLISGIASIKTLGEISKKEFRIVKIIREGGIV